MFADGDRAVRACLGLVTYGRPRRQDRIGLVAHCQAIARLGTGLVTQGNAVVCRTASRGTKPGSKAAITLCDGLRADGDRIAAVGLRIILGGIGVEVLDAIAVGEQLLFEIEKLSARNGILAASADTAIRHAGNLLAAGIDAAAGKRRTAGYRQSIGIERTSARLDLIHGDRIR